MGKSRTGLRTAALALGVANLLFVSDAYAANWNLIFRNAGGVLVYVDDQGVSKNSGLNSVWVKLVGVEDEVNPYKKLDNAKYYYQYRCADRNLSISSAAFYYVDGSTRHANMGVEFSPVPPESVAETIMKLVCRGR